MRVTLLTLTLSLVAAALTPTAAMAGKLGDHPAVVTQRLHAVRGYDYASKFYPHPAQVRPSAETPRQMGRHPAVIVAEREQMQRASACAHATQAQAATTSEFVQTNEE